MKKAFTVIISCFLVSFIAVTVFPVNTAFAESDNDYLFSSKSNNTWVLKKSTRKMVLVNFEKKNQLWKSKVITIPEEFNVNECIITAVGMRGTTVSLFDASSGLLTLYSAGDDGSIKTYLTGSLKEDLK